MQEGVPKRLLSMSATGVTEGTLRSFAGKISDDTALKEDVVKSAVETWAVALGYKIAAPPPPPPPPREGTGGMTGGRIDADPAAPARPRPRPTPGARPRNGLLVALGIALLVQAALKLYFALPYVGRVLGMPMYLGAFVFLLTVVVGLASIPLGIGAILRAPWARPIGLVVCAIGAAVYLYIFAMFLSMSYPQQIFNTLANVLGLAAHAGGFVGFLLWRPAGK
jgi:hypothetical protein